MLFLINYENIIKTDILTAEMFYEMVFMKYVARSVKTYLNYNVGYFDIEDDIFM
jgi:hypothetical protein